MLRFCVNTWALLLLTLSTSALAGGYFVVTYNKNIPYLSDTQVKMFYRGQLSHISGVNTSILDLPNHSPLRDDFYFQLLGKDPAQMHAIWARLIFSGRAKAPYELGSASQAEVFRWLQLHKNGIAYIPQAWIQDDVKVIYRLTQKEEQ